MKKILLTTLGILALGTSIVYAAPYYSFQRSILPIDSTENIGTTTSPWDIGFFNQLCLNGTCKTVWPTGGGGGSGGGTTATSTAWGSIFYNYPLNDTDIWTIGYDGAGTATSTNEAEYYLDPVAKQAAYLNGTKLGIGTTSPYATLSVVGQIVGEYFTATSTNATSTFSGNLQAVGTSTFNGINLTAGSVVYYGTDVLIDANGNIHAIVLPLQDTAANLSATVALSGQRIYETDTGYTKIGDGTTAIGSLTALNAGQWSTNGTKVYYSTNNVGIGTSSPYARLSVEQGSTDSDVFAVGDEGTSTPFLNINARGWVGFGAVPTGSFTMTGIAPADVSSGSGVSASTIGAISMTAARGGNTTDTASSKQGGTGGNVTLAAGAGGTANSSATQGLGGTGGAFTVNGGAGGASTAPDTARGGTGGALNFVGGIGGAASTGVTVRGGPGGGVNFTGGTGLGGLTYKIGGNGGALTFLGGSAGAGTSTPGIGGSISFTTGLGGSDATKVITTGGASGDLTFAIQNGGIGVTGGNAGSGSITGGNGGASDTGNGGNGSTISVTSGNGGASTGGGNGGSAGDLKLTAGNSGTGGTQPNGGNLYLIPGTGTINGNILLGINSSGTVRGNVGIGTSSPYATLSVVGASGVVADHYTATGTVASVFPYASTTMVTATTASTSQFFGANLATCNNATNDKLLWANGLFSCGSDQTGAGGTVDGAGIAGMMTAWTDGNSLQATSTIIGNDFIATSTTATSSFQGSVRIGTTTRDNLFQVTANRIYPASNSVGGMVNLTNTNNTGPALVVYTNNGDTSTGNLVNFNCDNTAMAHDCVKISHDGSGDGLSIAATAGASNALSLSNTGVDHTLNAAYTGSTAQKGALNLTSTNTGGSVFQISGVTAGLGIGKITNTGVGDANSSILSLSATNAGYLGQGEFADISMADTAQKLMNWRANGNEVFTLLGNGNLGLSTSSPYAKLSVVGEVVGANFTATTTASSTLPRISATGISSSWLCLDTCRIAWPTGTVTSVGLSSSNSTLTIGSTPVTTSGTITADLNLGHANDWTALQTFTNATTTKLSSNNTQLFNLLRIPTSTDPTISTTGDIAINTTAASSSIRFHDGTEEVAVYGFWTQSPYFATSTLGGIIIPGQATTSIEGKMYIPEKSRLEKLVCKSYGSDFQLGLGTSTEASGTGTNIIRQATTTITTFTGKIFEAGSTLYYFAHATSTAWSRTPCTALFKTIGE